MILTSDELELLTGKQKRTAQVRELRSMGFMHKIRADGFPVVLKSHVHKTLDGEDRNHTINEEEPNWGEI